MCVCVCARARAYEEALAAVDICCRCSFIASNRLRIPFEERSGASTGWWWLPSRGDPSCGFSRHFAGACLPPLSRPVGPCPSPPGVPRHCARTQPLASVVSLVQALQADGPADLAHPCMAWLFKTYRRWAVQGGVGARRRSSLGARTFPSPPPWNGSVRRKRAMNTRPRLAHWHARGKRPWGAPRRNHHRTFPLTPNGGLRLEPCRPLPFLKLLNVSFGDLRFVAKIASAPWCPDEGARWIFEGEKRV